MDTLDFLQRVLPGTGPYFAFGSFPGGRKKQVAAATLSDLIQITTALDTHGYDTYNSMAAFVDPNGGRKQVNARTLKSFFLDIDCKDPATQYPNWREALRALGEFVTKFSLPSPMIVRSGGGLHVYWPLTSEVAAQDWQPVAEALKALCISNGLIIDPSVPADSARILRTPGTQHKTYRRTVTVVLDAPDVDFNNFKSLLKVGTPAAPAAQGTKYTLLDKLSTRPDLPPANSFVVETKCQQVAWAVNNQANVTEPHWYALLGVAAHCDDPDNTALRWSNQHPGFNAAQTLAKLAQWKQQTTGPATCKRLETDNPNGCKGCKYKDKITSPVQIGTQYAEVATIVDAPDAGQVIPPPKPFKRASIGMVITIDDTDIEICPFDIYPISYGYDEHLGFEIARFKWKRPHVGWKDLVFRQALLVDGEYKDFSKTIADQGIVLYNKKRTETFQLMLRSYMDELRRLQTMTNHYNSMGWKNGFREFLIGDTLYSVDANGSVIEQNMGLSMSTTAQADRTYSKKGDYDQWRKLSGVLSPEHFPVHSLAACASLSSVFYAFTGLKGLTFSLYGDTGTGKTLAQKWMQSVWGNPEELHFAAKFTMNSLFNRMATHCHLPMTVDETTIMNDKEVGEFIYWVSQGRDKARLTKTISEREPRAWATFVTLSTNRSMASKLVSGGNETDAQMVRLLELRVPPSDVFSKSTDIGAKIYNVMHANYGYAGREFIRNLLPLGEERIRKLVEAAPKLLKDKFGVSFSGQERYWEQFLALTYLAGMLAKKWGIIAYDVAPAIEWALKEINLLRKDLKEDMRTSFDVVADYLNEYAGHSVTVMHTLGVAKPMADMNRLPRDEVRIRYDVFRKSAIDPFDKGTVLIDKHHFRVWASRHGYDYRGIIHDITFDGALATPKNGKALLTKDTGIKSAQTNVFGIKMNHTMFDGVFETADAAADSLTLGKVVSIKGGKE